MKELTLDKAMRLHKELYLTMSKLKNYNEFLGKDLYTLKEYCLKRMGFVDNECPRNLCFLCEYAKQQYHKSNCFFPICHYCPLPSHCTSWDPYSLLQCVFNDYLGAIEISDEGTETIRNACIEISEPKCEMLK